MTGRRRGLRKVAYRCLGVVGALGIAAAAAAPLDATRGLAPSGGKPRAPLGVGAEAAAADAAVRDLGGLRASVASASPGKGGHLVVDDGAGRPAALVVRRAVPGAVGGVVLRIRNAGPAPTRVSLERERLAERPGQWGGRLSRRLVLELSGPGQTDLFTGSPAAFGVLDLGRLAPGAERRLRMRLRFPDGGPPPGPTQGDNAYQGAAMAVRYRVRPG